MFAAVMQAPIQNFSLVNVSWTMHSHLNNQAQEVTSAAAAYE